MGIEEFYNISSSEEEKNKFYKEYKKEKKDIEDEFSKKTTLNKQDFKFLFFAIALQVIRQYMLGGEIGEKFNSDDRPEHDNKAKKEENKTKREEYKKKHYKNKIVESEKSYRTWLEIVMTEKVPYDATKGSPKFKLNLCGKNHRLKTLGHDPLLGWIFGTLNILTDTITLKDFSSYQVNMKNTLEISNSINTIEIFKGGHESISEDWRRLPAAIFSQRLHFSSDEFTKMGLPVPLITILNEKKAEQLYKKNYDSVCAFRDLKIIGKQAFFSIFINQIISFVHEFYYNEKEYENEKIYEIKTRKIILYSNIIASTSNILVSYFSKSIKNLDIGGFMVTLYRIVNDIPFMMKIKEEYVNTKLNEKYQSEIDNLNNEITKILEELNFKI